MQNSINCFTADFRDGKVTVGGETFPSGFFFVNSMNEYWKPYTGNDTKDFEIAPKLLTMRFGAQKVLEELTLGLLNPQNTDNLYNDILYKINTISKSKPFCFMDLDAEKERCKQIFSAENIEKICAYLQKRVLFYSENQTGWANIPLPTSQDYAWFSGCQSLLNDFRKTVAFYEELGQGMDNARKIGMAFVAALKSPIKRTEGNLMAMALDCIKKYRPTGFTEFERAMQVNMEYVPVPKTKNHKAFEVGRRMTFERFGDFLLADLFEGIHAGHYPLRCGVCKQYFLQTTAHRRKYCSGYAPDDPKGRSCEAFAARNNRLEKENAPDHPVKLLYNRRRGTIDKHVQRRKINKKQADAAKRHIEILLDKAISDNEYFNNYYEHDISLEEVYKAANIKI